MGRRKKKYGTCKLCGKEGKLSFEHVPPKSAFNNQREHFEATMDDLLKLSCVDLDSNLRIPANARRIKQGGIGFYSLCESCNNITGSWYASEFVKFSMQAMFNLLKANGKPTLFYPMYFHPLRVVKQIVTMFFSICIDGMRDLEPELQHFVLNREMRYLSPRYKIYCYSSIPQALLKKA